MPYKLPVAARHTHETRECVVLGCWTGAIATGATAKTSSSVGGTTEDAGASAAPARAEARTFDVGVCCCVFSGKAFTWESQG